MLYLAGNVVPPSRTTTGTGPPKKSYAGWIVAGAFALLGAVLTITVATTAVKRLRELTGGAEVKPDDYVLTQRFASSDGRLVAHYPASFTAAPGKSEAGKYLSVNVTRRGGSSTVGLLAILTPVSDDPAELDRAIMQGVRSAWAKEGMDYKELRHHSGLCLGEPGEITEGTLEKYLVSLKVWQCTFLRLGEGFHFFYLTSASGDSREPEVLLKIMEATDITP
jgi:hypothetical protein